jgi:hypothetical protein
LVDLDFLEWFMQKLINSPDVYNGSDEQDIATKELDLKVEMLEDGAE